MHLTVTVIHRFEFPSGACPWATEADLKRLEALVSALSDKIAEVKAAVDAAVGRVQSDVAALNARIDDLQAKVDAGGATPEDMAMLDELKAKVEAIDPTSSTVLPGG
jgi:predicted  nucleic acid-binding Zn-ribbon protein